MSEVPAQGQRAGFRLCVTGPSQPNAFRYLVILIRMTCSLTAQSLMPLIPLRVSATQTP